MCVCASVCVLYADIPCTCIQVGGVNVGASVCVCASCTQMNACQCFIRKCKAVWDNIVTIKSISFKRYIQNVLYIYIHLLYAYIVGVYLYGKRGLLNLTYICVPCVCTHIP